MRLHNPHFNPSYFVPVPSKHLCRAVFLSVCSSKVHACMTCREGARGNRQCFNWRWTCQLYILTLDIFMPRKAHFSACSLQLLSGVNCVFMCACARTCVHVPYCILSRCMQLFTAVVLSYLQTFPLMQTCQQENKEKCPLSPLPSANHVMNTWS